MEKLPEHVEKIISDAEEALTKEVREITGRDDLVVKYDRRPLWPDDFRGFGSNVRPKKQP